MPISVVYDTTCVSATGKCCAWTVPAGVTSVTFEIWGGGGGGANGLMVCNCCARTQSGGGGGYSLKTIPVTPGSVYTVCAGNAGVDATCNAYGAAANFCCNGVTGGTSFVTGNGLTGFCATGGVGGCGTFEISCYGHCGCNGAPGGQGYGGDINESGTPGVKGMAGGSNAYASYTMGGTAGGPGGGVGGFNTGSCNAGASNSNPALHGTVPGGGGAGHGCAVDCSCFQYGSGRGAPGFVKITW